MHVHLVINNFCLYILSIMGVHFVLILQTAKHFYNKGFKSFVTKPDLLNVPIIS